MNNVRKGLNFIYLEPTPPNNERAKEREKEWAKERKEEWKKEWRTSKTNHLKYPPFIAIKQIQDDWLRDYCYAPVLLETFVDTSHFAGTCYKASNWTYLGETQGRGRMDRKNEYGLSRKAIYM